MKIAITLHLKFLRVFLTYFSIFNEYEEFYRMVSGISELVGEVSLFVNLRRLKSN